MNISQDTDIYRQIISFQKYKNGSSGTGSQGPALFTLTDSPYSTPVEILTPNSIATTGTNNTYGVNTVESYRTAFLTFKLNSGTPIVGLVNVDRVNTFSFGFQFDGENTYSIASNGNGSTGSYNYNYGDLFTICLTSATCTYYQNGVLVNSVITDTNYLNVFSKFYIPGIANITNISFGYLNDVPNVLGYTYNSGGLTYSNEVAFLTLANTENTLLVNCQIGGYSDNCFILPTGIYNISVSYQSSTPYVYYVFYGVDQVNWTQSGIGMQGSSSNTVILNLTDTSYVGIGSLNSDNAPSGEFYISVNRLI